MRQGGHFSRLSVRGLEEIAAPRPREAGAAASGGQLRLHLGPELVRREEGRGGGGRPGMPSQKATL
jgi:hypothetical protein